MSPYDDDLDEESPSALEALEVDRNGPGDQSAVIVAERLDLGFDVEALRAHVLEHVVSLPAVWQTNGYGGWSVLSHSGLYTDGWGQGHVAFRPDGSLDRAQLLTIRGGIYEQMHTTPTEICTGPIAAVIDRVRALGFQPYRARVALLKAGASTSRHRDDVDGAYRIRLHIPNATQLHSLPCVDLLPALRAAARQGSPYYRIAAHFNARGHEVAAEAIVDSLMRGGSPVSAAAPASD